MKIIGVTNNYGILPAGTRPGWLYIPDSAMIRSRKPFFVPDFDSEFSAYLSAALRIDRVGKGIAPRFASRYWGELTAAVSIRATGLASRLAGEGLPWGEAVVFDRSLLLGDFISPEDFNSGGKSLRLTIDGEQQLEWTADDCVLDFADIISAASRDNTLKTGDIIMPALTEKGVVLHHPSLLRVECGDRPLLETRIR